MDRKIVLMIALVLIVGIGVGYGLGHIAFQPQILGLQSEISILRGEYDSLNASFSQLQAAYYQLHSWLNAQDSFPIFPTYNFSSHGILTSQTLNETFMELRYSMGCEWSLVVTEFLVNKSMTTEEVNETTMAYLSDWVKNVFLGNMTLVDEGDVHGHVVLIYGTHSEDRKIYSWYCDVSGILFMVWSEAYCDWTYEIVSAVVASIDCH